MSTARRSVAFLLVCLSMLVPLGAHQSPPNIWAGSGIVAGAVTNAATGGIVTGATVCMWNAVGNPVQSCVITDAQGRFAHRGVSAGSFRMAAEASGFLLGGYAQRVAEGPSTVLEMKDGERRLDVRLQVFPYGWISGTVVDDRGEGIVGAMVYAMVRRPRTGFIDESWLLNFNTGQTDDRGQFLLQVAPGEYAVYVHPGIYASVPSSAAKLPSMRAGDRRVQLENSGRSGVSEPLPPVEREGAPYVFGAGLSPALVTPDQPAFHTVVSGRETSNVSFSLRLLRAYQVTGHAIGTSGPLANARVRLLPLFTRRMANDDGMEVAASTTDARGDFSFADVAPGQYRLVAYERPSPAAAAPAPAAAVEGVSGQTLPMGNAGLAGSATSTGTVTLSSETIVTVADRPLNDVQLSIRNGVRVRGRYVFEGAITKPSQAAVQRSSSGLVSLDGAVRTIPTIPSADYSFVSAELPAGRYVAQPFVSTQGWFPKSVTLGGRDVLDRVIELGAQDVAELVYTFTDQPPRLEGTVRRDARAAGPETVVIAVGEDYLTSTTALMTTLRRQSVKVQPDGRFVIDGLVAGRYLVAAVDEAAAGRYPSAAFMTSLLKSATAITLSDGARTQADLRVIEVRR